MPLDQFCGVGVWEDEFVYKEGGWALLEWVRMDECVRLFASLLPQSFIILPPSSTSVAAIAVFSLLFYSLARP